MKNVHAFIDNISVPKTTKQLLSYMQETEWYVIESLFEDSEDYESGWTSWTAPKWAKIGDIVFFMHAKTADYSLKCLRKQIINEKESLTQEAYTQALNFIEHGLELHKTYGGKIFAFAEVNELPEYYYSNLDKDERHWSSDIYAVMTHIVLLEHHVDISE